MDYLVNVTGRVKLSREFVNLDSCVDFILIDVLNTDKDIEWYDYVTTLSFPESYDNTVWVQERSDNLYTTPVEYDRKEGKMMPMEPLMPRGVTLEKLKEHLKEYGFMSVPEMIEISIYKRHRSQYYETSLDP
uniref:Uncharacterized protein n=1 Tax=viral metagenome TaxID=1070528 RepID=A0A6C0CJ97_9ZZZZ